MRRGVLEGFFGEPWSWEARHDSLPFLVEHGFDLYVYAPKADRNLRGRWADRHPTAVEDALSSFAQAGKDAGIDVAIGLSPLELFQRWSQDGPTTLLKRVDELRALGITGLGLFFDDMRGDFPALATTQAAMVAAVRRAHPDLSLWMCPTYYTPHDVLDRVFGQRPPNYLATLGDELPDDVEVFWTGEKVCSESYTAEHLEHVGAELGRPVAIWDNYPVNDGPRMCKRLHTRPPGGRGPELTDWVSTWCINPMNQAVTSRLPMAAITKHLAGVEVDVEALANTLYGPGPARSLLRWMDRFQDDGLDALSSEAIAEALAEFSAFPHPVAAEICHWLRGESIVGPECLTDTED